MKDTTEVLAKAVGPRLAIRQYLERIAEEYRSAGLVPWRGRWIAPDERQAKLDGASRSGRIILAELVLLFAALTGSALILLLVMYYLAY
jgi:hypothetical protein